jgi:hypothetical protein
MDKNIGTIQRIVFHVTCLLKGLYIQNWKWFSLDTNFLYVEKAKVQQLCCCVICVGEVGI